VLVADRLRFVPMPSRELSKKIRIVNPIENGSSLTSRARALQYVRAGRAVFVGQNSVRFLDTHPGNQSAREQAAAGYQSIDRGMTVSELAHIPIIRPTSLMVDRTRVPVRRSLAGRNGPVRFVMSEGIGLQGLLK
jgi:hypothetical protein